MMRNKFFIFIVLSLYLYGCSVNYNYQIDGSVRDNSLDGEYIYLQEMLDNKLVTIDSTLVKDTKFVFKGKQEAPVIRELSFLNKKARELAPLVFVLQAGNLQAFIDTVSYVTGTEQNDQLHDYFEQLHYYQSRISNLITQYQMLSISNEMTDSIQNAFQEWYDSVRNELNKLSYDFILQNSNSVAGGLVFLQSYSQLTPNQVESILLNAGPYFRTMHGVEIVEEQLRREKKVAVGNQYIDFTMNNLQGLPVTLSSLIEENQWVLLDFWASWCLPCEQDLPYLKNIYNKFSQKGLKIVGISLDSSFEDWQQGILRFQMPWLQLSDLRGWECDAALIYGIQTLPYTILINPEGIITARGIRHQALETELEKIFDSN
ncbi:MAG: TlpA disulfide reductase family protein [Bacteroidales bacterium]